MVANPIKLVLLLIGFIGYLTGSQEPSEEVRSLDHHRDKRSIYLNSKSPILIGTQINTWNVEEIKKFIEKRLLSICFNL